MESPLSFEAATETGRGRGKELRIPTINLRLTDVPQGLKDGIYACFVSFAGTRFKGAMHLGPRPAFNDTNTCEVHVIDASIDRLPDRVSVEIIAYLRPVLDFATTQALLDQISVDIADARSILSAAEGPLLS